MSVVNALSPAILDLERIWDTAIQMSAEEVAIQRFEDGRVRARAKAGGEWREIQASPDALCQSLAERLEVAISSSPERGYPGWLRISREPLWRRSDPTYIDGVPGAQSSRPGYVDYHIAEIPDFAAARWQLLLVNPLLLAQIAYKDEDYATAYRMLEWMRSRGNPDALALLADLYRNGRGIARDDRVANELVRQAQYPESQWCLIGNIVEGTRHFKPGAKVHCLRPQWGDGYENIIVVGRHRDNNRYVTMVMRSAYVTNWRAKVIYSPTVLHRLNWAGLMWSSELVVRQWVTSLRERGENR